MKKKMLGLLLATAMGATLLAGCGSSNTGAASSTDTAKTETADEKTEDTSTEVASESAWKPTQPVTVICPYGAGGGQDIAARLFAKYAEKYAGVNFVVDNQTGGSGTIGNTAISMADPDGYTLGMFCNVNLYDQFLVEGVTYTEDSFTQLAIFSQDATVIVANKKLGVSTMDELIELAKSKPGEVTWGGPEFTAQTYPRINVENATGAQFGKMIFDGGNASLVAVAGGNCGVTSVFPSEYMAMADNADLVVLATTGPERMESMPDVPTMKEQGVDATFSQWRSYVLPAGASDDVIAYYDDVFAQVMADEDFQKELADGGFNFVNVVGHEDCTQFMEDDFNANKDAIIAAAQAQ